MDHVRNPEIKRIVDRQSIEEVQVNHFRSRTTRDRIA
jgi:hypothetical protein